MAAIEQRWRYFAGPRRGTSWSLSVCAYDLRGRLVSVTTDGIVSEWYAYDLNGNKRAQSPRRSRRATAILRPARKAGARSRIRRRSGNCHRTNSLVAADLRAAEYDAQDRLLSSGSATFACDANGSRISQLLIPNSSLLTAYSYDLFGQLASVTLPDGRAVSYDRDALNRVTAKRVNGAVTQGWIYKDGLKPVAETDASGSIVSLFVYGTSALSPDYMVKDGTTYRFIRDFQGSVRLVVNADTGAVAQCIDYDAFGRSVSTELTQSGNNAITQFSFQPFGFQSGLYDPDTGLVHFGARWYDPASGRWLSKDPILLEGGLNLYAFCGNDPVNFVDPDGLNVVYLIDTEAVNGWGHAASAVGNDKTGWTFYSFGSAGDRNEPMQWGPQDNYTVRHYQTYEQLLRDNPRYDGTIFYQTNRDADMAAFREGNSHFNDRYWPLGMNCDDVASAIIRAAGINFDDKLLPVNSYEANRRGGNPIK